jgi:probable selenate reductase FAD-binding subunit
MTKVKRYIRPTALAEALAAKRAEPTASFLAGGTALLAGDERPKGETVIDISMILGREISREGTSLSLGALATFQDLADSRAVPPFLAEAALTMVNRNTRNRATVGGNIGADKSCSSLIPILVVLGAEVEIVSPYAASPRRMGLEVWLRSRAEESDPERGSDLALRLLVPLEEGRRAAYRRWNRTACDLSVLGAAVSYLVEGGALRSLRIAMGGFGPKARSFGDLEALFEGSPLSGRSEIEALASKRLEPISDLRASAAFKRLRGSQLLADALLEAGL